MWFGVVGGTLCGLVILGLGWGWNQTQAVHISVGILQAAFLLGFLGAPFSRYLRRSWPARISALLALIIAVIASLAA